MMKIIAFFKVVIILFLELILLIVFGYCGICPPLDDIRPCFCDPYTIRCYANVEFDLDEVFETIANGKNDAEKSFETLEISSFRLTELSDSIFRGVSFKTIKLLHCNHLDCVSPTAFYGMEKTLMNFFTFDTSFRFERSLISNVSSNSSDCNIFNALRRLPNLRAINITGSKITEIPGYAFRESYGSLIYLNSIDLSGGEGGDIARVGKHAFSALRGLKYIDLSSHKISKVEPYGFAFKDTSFDKLTINLENNRLTADSFDSQSLEVNGRETELKLGANPKIQVLKESVFLSFLTTSGNTNPLAHNVIDLRGTPITCNKENLWLLENKHSLHRKIVNMLSKDSGFDFWKHTKKQCSQ